MKKAIYARVSTQKQSEQEQIPEIIKGFELNENEIELYREELSAWNIDKESKRLEFQRLKEDIKKKNISALYIWDIDRLYRNRLKTKDFFQFCQFYKVDVYSLNQRWLNDFQDLKAQMPDNMAFLIDNIFTLLLDVYAQTAEDESNKKSKRVKLKVKKDKEGVTRSVSGKKWGRKALPKQTRDLIIKLHYEGHSIRQIAGMVQTWKNGNSYPISKSAVHKTIQEKTYKK